MQQEETFVQWLNAELDRRGWSRSEAARRGEFSASMLDKVIGGFASPGLDTCRGIARAFKLPLEDVFRLAGILPARMVPREARVNQRNIVYNIDTGSWGRRIMEMWRGLSPEDQQLVVDLIERLAGPQARIVGEEE